MDDKEVEHAIIKLKILLEGCLLEIERLEKTITVTNNPSAKKMRERQIVERVLQNRQRHRVRKALKNKLND